MRGKLLKIIFSSVCLRIVFTIQKYQVHRNSMVLNRSAYFINFPILCLLLLVAAAQARISVMYAHDKLSDMVAEQCLNAMYPRVKHVEFQESDEPCIIFCVLKKFGIMNSNGVINLEAYRKRVLVARQNELQTSGTDYGGTCIESAEATQHKQDVCKKAKVFNDCTHLYRILLK